MKFNDKYQNYDHNQNDQHTLCTALRKINGARKNDLKY